MNTAEYIRLVKTTYD